MKFVLLAVFPFVFLSCATLMNGPYTVIEVSTFPDSAKIKIENHPQEFISPAVIPVKRAKQDLNITVVKDSITRNYTLKSKLSPAYTFGNLFSWGLYGYLYDLTNPKRFQYESYSHFNLLQEDNYSQKKWLTEKNKELNLVFSIPYINNFYLNDGNEYVPSNGFFGFDLGMEYYHTPNNYLSIVIGTATDFLVPVPASVNYDGDYSSVSAKYFNVKHNYIYNRTHFGAGLCFTSLNHTRHLYNDIEYQSSSFRNRGFGLSLSSQFRLSKRFYVGVLYQPMIFEYSSKWISLDYQHFLSVKLDYKIRLSVL